MLDHTYQPRLSQRLMADARIEAYNVQVVRAVGWLEYGAIVEGGVWVCALVREGFRESGERVDEM